MLKTKKPSVLPIIVKEEHEKQIPEGIQLYLMSFKWVPMRFVNIDSGEEVKIKFWHGSGGIPLTRMLNVTGRHRLIHEKIPRYILDAEGKVIETRFINKTRIIGKSFGFRCLSEILSAIFPCSIDEAKKLVQEAVSKNLAHAYLVLKSDLCPCSPSKWKKMGNKNFWVCIAQYPTSDKLQENLNRILKLQGSPLRAQFALKWVLKD